MIKGRDSFGLLCFYLFEEKGCCELLFGQIKKANFFRSHLILHFFQEDKVLAR